jgi:hypothetical protein
MYCMYIREREHGLPFRTPRWIQQEDEAVDRSTRPVFRLGGFGPTAQLSRSCGQGVPGTLAHDLAVAWAEVPGTSRMVLY